MKPSDLGLPRKFTKWRPDQEEAIFFAGQSDKRFVGLNCPPGFGKSAMYLGLLGLDSHRGAILTSSRALQDQLTNEFARKGLAEIRGQHNYTCRLEQEGRKPKIVTVDEGPCHFGVKCDYRSKGCSFYDARKEAASHLNDIVVTNYSFWMADHYYGEGLGYFDTLVLDEAHAAPEHLSNFLGIEFTEEDFADLQGDQPPTDSGRWAVWGQRWADQLAVRFAALKAMVEAGRGDSRLIADMKRAKTLMNKMRRVARATTSWVRDTVEVRGARGTRHQHVRFDPVSPADFAEEILFRGVKKVILTSATLRPKTMDMLGIKEEDREFREFPSSFPAARRPIIYIPTARIDRKSGEDDLIAWRDQIDNIIDRRQDRKGLIQTVSYQRQQFILMNSRHARVMHDHARAKTGGALDAFRKARPPAVFVSPSVTTGIDLPYEQCEYIIIAKLPFPMTQSEIMKARCAKDKTLRDYLTAVELQQGAGRGMRAADDWCEIFIIDDHAEWFIPKCRRMKLLSKHFLEAYREEQFVPKPITRGRK